MKYVFIIDNIVVSTVTLYAEGATAVGPAGSTEYDFPNDSPIDVGWKVDTSVNPPVFTP